MGWGSEIGGYVFHLSLLLSRERISDSQKRKSVQRGSVWPEVPADIWPKTSVRPTNRCFGTDMPRGRPRKKLRSEKLLIECFRAWHRGGRNFTSFCVSPDPFFMQQNEPFLPKNLCRTEGNPPEAPLELWADFFDP